MTLELSDDPARLDLDRVHGWLATTYWSPGVARDVVERALAGSWAVGAYDGGTQVGVARLASDRATFAWLADVFVAPEARGAGVGRALVEAALAQARSWGVRRVMLATKDAHGLYEGYGFTPLEDGRFLELRLASDAAAGATAARPAGGPAGS